MGRLNLKTIRANREVAASVAGPVLVGLRDRKVAGSYARLTPGPDGRIRTLLSENTASGRLSSGESPLFKDSTNLQNAEKKVAKLDPLYNTRDVIIADPGMVLLAGDYVGAEAFGVAAYSKDWAYLEKLYSGVDTHTELAKFFWGDLFEKATATERKLFRDIAKTIKYASSYVAKARTVCINLNKESDRLGRKFTELEVAGYLQKLYTIHPLQEWWESIRIELKRNDNVLRNCFGYRRKFHDPEPDNRLKDGSNFFPQSTVAWLMNDSLPKLYTRLHKPGVRQLLHQVHDEALWQCKPDEIPTIVKVSQEIMQRPFKVNGRELYIPVDFKMGDNWGAGMKEVKI